MRDLTLKKISKSAICPTNGAPWLGHVTPNICKGK